MKEFPYKIHVDNKQKFKVYYTDRVLCYLRRDIYEHIISNKESSYFDLGCFNKKYLNDHELTNKLCDLIIIELNKLGWTCIKSFGDTGLFIYSDIKPSNCWT